MLREPFYDPNKSYGENFEQGPYGAFMDKKVAENEGKPRSRFKFLGFKC